MVDKTANSKQVPPGACMRLDELPKDIEVFTIKQFEDNRGFLRCLFEAEGRGELHLSILKLSYSKQHVARGIHWQRLSHPQSKLITVLQGKIIDVLVDLDKGSPDYGRVYKVVLDASEQKCLLIPPKYGHGFLALEDTTFLYACSGVYSEKAELSICIAEHLEPFVDHSRLILSDKDKAAVPLAEIKTMA